jgi:hypothetical protein
VRCARELDGNNFLIMKMELPQLIKTSGYELVIRTKGEPLDKKTSQNLRDIASRENLRWKKKTSVLIFDPLQKG